MASAVVLAMAAVALASHARPSPPEARPAAAPAQRAPERPATRALRDGERISLNDASAEELELLPGIGPALARRIVASREEEGAFASIEELDRVKGIGPRMLERLRPHLSVSVRVEDQAEAQAGRDDEEVHGLGVPDG